MHRFSSRSDESDDLSARPASGYPPRARAPVCGSAPANVLYGTLRRPIECNAGGAQRTPDDFVGAVENLCIIRARQEEEPKALSSKDETIRVKAHNPKV